MACISQQTFIAEESGFPNLGDVDEYVPDFLFCAVCTRMNWANENRDRVIGLLRLPHGVQRRRKRVRINRQVSGYYLLAHELTTCAPSMVGLYVHSVEHNCCSAGRIVIQGFHATPQRAAGRAACVRHTNLIKDQSCIDVQFLDATGLASLPHHPR